MVVRNPTLPKFTPSAGTVVPSRRRSARSIVPSPPRTITMSASDGSASARSMSCFSSSSAGITGSTPKSAATARRRSIALPTVSRRPCVITAARLTGSGTDGLGDPAVELGRKVRALGLDELEEELAVSLRARQPGVDHGARFGAPSDRRLRDLPQHAPVHDRIAHDPAPGHVLLTRLE